METVPLGWTRNYLSGDVFFGSEKKKGSLLFDTAVSFVSVTSDRCGSCITKVYSDTGSKTAVIGEARNITYTAQAYAIRTTSVSDDVCFGSTDFCAKNFTFFETLGATTMNGLWDGIVGLAPEPTVKSADRNFLTTLARQNVIQRSVFALKLGQNETETNLLHIGDYDPKFVEGGESSIDWYDTITDTAWSVKMTDMVFANTTIFVTVGAAYKTVLLNPGLIGVGLDPDAFAQFVYKVQNINTPKPQAFLCDESTCNGIKGNCSSFDGMLPDLHFVLGNHHRYTIKGNELLMDYFRDQCHVSVYNTGKKDQFTLGWAFLKDVYTVFDLEYYRVGLGPLSDYSASMEETEETDLDEISGAQGWAIAVVVISLVVLVGCLGACYKLRRAPGEKIRLEPDGEEEETNPNDTLLPRPAQSLRSSTKSDE